MTSAPTALRLTRAQFAVVVVASGLAAVLVITSAVGRSAAQSAALAALRRGSVTVRIPGRSAAPAPVSVPVSDSSPAAWPSAVTPSPTAPASSAGAGTSGSGGGGSSYTPSPAPTPQTPTLPPVKHVFVIALSAPSFNAAFGKESVAHYLNHKLRPAGTLLRGYDSLGRTPLPDELAMISGQAPNADTRSECATYAEFPTGAAPASDGLLAGSGCVYPNTVLTLADQVTSSGHVWGAYIDGMGATPCAHPNSDALDDQPIPGAGAGYATRHNPFIYFHSLLDLGGCASNDVSLDQLPAALRKASKTPTFSFIAPGTCTGSCLAGEDGFLKQWVPRILRSPAYKQDGMLVIAFALDGGSVPGVQPSPDTPAPAGALILSRYAKAGKTISNKYNAYSLLRSIEDVLGYQPLAHAKTAQSFALSVLSG